MVDKKLPIYKEAKKAYEERLINKKALRVLEENKASWFLETMSVNDIIRRKKEFEAERRRLLRLIKEGSEYGMYLKKQNNKKRLRYKKRLSEQKRIDNEMKPQMNIDRSWE